MSKQDNDCPICRETAGSRSATVRGGKQMTLWHCADCDFEFFAHDPTASLAADKLDDTRLQAAGLDIPTVEKDFANGLRQSAGLIGEYIDASDRGRSVLEIGCSWGYFLKLAQDAGARPHGVELNRVRAGYVRDRLGMPCDGSLDECERRGIRFKQIFMFYVLEYIPRPVEYLQRLVELLDDDGRLVLVTPSLFDPLKDLWGNTAFENFFYDEHAINYFSPLSVNRAIDRLTAGKAVVSTRQGYSFANHIGWFLTGVPRTTGVVGGDNFVRDIVGQLRKNRKPGQDAAAAHLAEMIEDFDASYKRYLESQQLGNQICITVCR